RALRRDRQQAASSDRSRREPDPHWPPRVVRGDRAQARNAHDSERPMSPSVRGTSGPAPDDGRLMVHPYTGEVLDPDNVPDETRTALLEVPQRALQDAVGERLDKLAADAKGGRPSRWSWQHADRQRCKQMWKELVAFVDWLIDRYRPTGEVTIRPCWYRHPVAV